MRRSASKAATSTTSAPLSPNDVTGSAARPSTGLPIAATSWT